MIVRSLSPSRLRKLLVLPFHLTTYARRPASDSIHSIASGPSQSYSTPKNQPFLFSIIRPLSSQSAGNQLLSSLPLTRDGNYDDESAERRFPICPGCGIPMQDFDSSKPGFFIKSMKKGPNYKILKKMTPIEDESEIAELVKMGVANELVEAGKYGRAGNGDHPFDEMSQKDPSDGGSDRDMGGESQRPVVCSRCHSLRYYGKVRNPSSENLLPDFDFDHTIGRRLTSVSGGRTIVLLVVDASDFDGSFPRKAANLVSKTIDENALSWKEGRSGNVPRVVLVVTKIDLLPSSISPTGFEHWVRTRARDCGMGKLTCVHLVSAMKDWGVKTLVDDVVRFAGHRGHVWAVGAQNAGKSTLINAIGKCVGTKVTHLTEAPVPGTTLGIVRVEGVLPGKAKLFDTPGLLHPHQISTRLKVEEQKLIHIHKELKPRTYRIKAGHSVHIGGLARLDVEELSVDSIYVTVWASSLVPLHMGKVEKVSTMLEQHFGNQLQPPIGRHRIKELGNWVRKEFRVRGISWDSNSQDIAVSGLGWFAIGLKGEARLSAWTYEGVDLVLRNSVMQQRSRSFEVAGFTVSEIVSKADRARNKKNQNKEEKSDDDDAAAAAGDPNNSTQVTSFVDEFNKAAAA